MTTPRVTVPVEPEYTATDYLRLIAEGWEVIESTGSQMTIQNPEDDGPQDLVIDVDAMLSAAPAPEGGAVSDAIRAKYDQVKGTAYHAGTPAERMKDGRLQGLNDALAIAMIAEERATLATREEAPAEAGDVEAWLIEHPTQKRQVVDARQFDASSDNFWISREVKSQFTVTPLRARATEKALAAYGSELGINALATTHPAPDTLRVAVEALLDLPELKKRREHLRKGIGTATDEGKVVLQALAALQAEQKGGA